MTYETENDQNEALFLRAYEKLCEKYGMRISIYSEDSLTIGSNTEQYREPIYTSKEVEEFRKSREAAEIRYRKNKYALMDVPTDEKGFPLIFEGPQLPPPPAHHYNLADSPWDSPWESLEGWPIKGK